MAVSIPAIDTHGKSVDFLLTAKHDLDAAKRLFRKMLRQVPLLSPTKIGTDGANTFPTTIKTPIDGGLHPDPDPIHYLTKHLRQGIESDHFRVKKNVPKIGGFEAMLWLKKGFGFSGDWTVHDQDDLLARLFGRQKGEKAEKSALCRLTAAPRSRRPESRPLQPQPHPRQTIGPDRRRASQMGAADRQAPRRPAAAGKGSDGDVRRVTVIASQSMIGEDIEAGTRTLCHRRAAIKGITLMPSTSLVAIEPGRLRLSPVFSDADAIGWAKYILMPGEEIFIKDVDWVVPVIGRRSREELYLDLKLRPEFGDIEIIRSGDCLAPRRIQSTILEAFELARNL